LNQRFQSRFGTTMDSESWAGWFAVKSLSEAVLRSRPASARELIDYLESERAVSDGHKGQPLSFRAWDHQLRQPLYVVEHSAAATRVIRQIPAGLADPGTLSRGVLDELGTGQSKTVCRWTEP
jgi:ABC transporter substrate binding protein (PQQ-dependent alcohol dehydrogenase system)